MALAAKGSGMAKQRGAHGNGGESVMARLAKAAMA
jgi:hypothetical protein